MMEDAVSSKVHLEPADQQLVEGVLARQRRALAKAITLIESSRRDHQARAAAVLEALLPHTGQSIRVGITGSPGVGKSTFIEALGLHLIRGGHRVAVLAVDPSSSVSGGSILGDKTRMDRLAQDANSFIRPSPSGGLPGGVAEKTREALLVCEAAGFDVIIVETVGVGQSETTVAGMVDVFVLLQLPHAGDDLQAIKKGIIELADLVVITKADIDPKAAALARHQFTGGLSMLRSASPSWHAPVLAVSATTRTGIDACWAEIERYRQVMTAGGDFQKKRQRQAIDWMWTLIDSGLRSRFRHHPQVRHHLDPLRRAVAAGRVTPAAAASRLLGYLETTSKNQGSGVRNQELGIERQGAQNTPDP
jgi:LAO/AO transport system kinase